MSRGGYQCTSCGASHVYSTYLLTRIGRETLIHGCQCGAKHRLTIQGAIQLEQGNTNPSLPRLPSLPVVPSERTFNAALIPPVDEPPVELPVTEWITEGHPVHVGWYELQFGHADDVQRWWWNGLRYHIYPHETSLHIEANAPVAWRGLRIPGADERFVGNASKIHFKCAACDFNSARLQHIDGSQPMLPVYAPATTFYRDFTPAP